MKVNNVVRTLIKYAPLVYPLVKKILDDRKKSSSPTRRK